MLKSTDGPVINEDLIDLYGSLGEPGSFGLSARLAYNIHLTEKRIIVPNISYYYGLSKEMKAELAPVKSMRFNVGVGLKL